MRLKSFKFKSLIFFFLLGINTSIKSQTLLNGGFESWPSACPYNTVPDNWENFSNHLAPDQAGCSGTVISYEGNSHMNLVWSTVSGFTDGLYEGAKQTITNLVIGKNYLINFYAINNQGLYSSPNSPVILDFYINSSVVFSSPELFSGGSWVEYSINYTPISSSVTIGFKANAGSTNTNGSLGIDNVSITQVTNINTQINDNILCVYPNPFETEFSIKIGSNTPLNNSLTITNIFGETILNLVEIKDINNKIIDLQGIPNGIYFLTIIIDGKQSSKKILKK